MECFNVLLVRPDQFIHHGAYSGSARQLCNGLRRLGHPARVAENEIVWDATNIVVGAQNLEPELIDRLPANTIIYNVEMVIDGSPFLQILNSFVRRFETWDYSAANVAAWHAAGISDRVRLLRPGYLPEDTAIDPAAPSDIDALFFGSLNLRRDAILADIARHGVRVHAAVNIYGPSRSALIARAKLILNIHSREDSVFEFARVSYALANHRLLVTEAGDTEDIDADLREALVIGGAAELGAICRGFLDDEPRRLALAERAFAIYARRDFTQSLREVLALRASAAVGLRSE
jgi:hypothetical protein